MAVKIKSTSAKAKILIAEDDSFTLRAYKDGLERDGFTVIPAVNGVEAMEKVRRETPDLILLDLIMPEKDGFEVLEELKTDPVLKDIPVIVVSNLGQEPDIQKTKDLGVVGYIVKFTASMKDVVEKVRFHLAKSKIKH